MITTTNLTKRYGTLSVLNGISLTVAKGEVAVVVGPSGGGKSTFLRCLNGLETFQEGSVEVAGVQLGPALKHRERNAVLGQLRCRVGMVFQQFNLFPHQTVLGNVIEAPMHVLGQSRDEAEATAKELLERVGMSAKLNVMPDTLSGGQQQRVAIARALAMKPAAILFDEPTSALDPRMAAEVESVITDLARDGQTMVVVTHSMRLARRAARTLYVFEGGRILEHGAPEQVFDAPREAATRRFLSEADGR
jgi:polar amino acid transport system ATP-binding protein